MVGAMQRSLFTAFIVTVGICTGVSYADLIENGDFSSGLAGWTYTPGVFVNIDGRATFSEEEGKDTLFIEQSLLPITRGVYDLRFDVTFQSPSGPSDETDALVVMLVDDNGPIGTDPLYELSNHLDVFEDISSPRDVGVTVTLSDPIPSSLWLRFQAEFDTRYDPDLGPTIMTVDNVSFELVPLPGAVSLLLVGFASLGLRRFRM